jgi:hypothetical protein
VAPSGNATAEAYEHEGLRVRRFRSSTGKHMLRELYGEGDPEAAMAFAHILDEERVPMPFTSTRLRARYQYCWFVRLSGVDCRFLHLSYADRLLPARHLDASRQGGLRWVLSVKRCTSCSLEGQAVPTPAAHLLSHVPLPFARALEQIGLSGGVWTALRMRELIRARHAAVQALLREVDGIVALKEGVRCWTRRARMSRSMSPKGPCELRFSDARTG